jgi:hypothetical protein
MQSEFFIIPNRYHQSSAFLFCYRQNYWLIHTYTDNGFSLISKNSGIIDVLCYFQVFVRMALESVRMETAKSIRYVRWGMMSSIGTDRGKLRNMGRRIARTGMDSARFDG